MFEQRVFDFGRTRRALLVGVLGLILGLGAASVVGQTSIAGPQALLDSASDNRDGSIKISWSLEKEDPDVTYHNSHPNKLCVFWKVVGSSEKHTETCFTNEISTQSDLLVDTGIGNEDTADYEVILHTYYEEYPHGGETQRAVVTVTGPKAQ